MNARYISKRTRVMTREAYRILSAVHGGRFRVAPSGRYVIDGESECPDRRTREALVKGGYIRLSHSTTPPTWKLTPLGMDAKKTYRVPTGYLLDHPEGF